MKVSVLFWSQYVIKIDIEKDDSVLSLKKKIFEKEKKKPKEQKLVFKGFILEDDKSLESYGIEDGSTIIFHRQYQGDGMIPLTVKILGKFKWRKSSDPPNCSTVEIEVPSTSTFYEVKKEIEKKTGIKPNEIHIHYASRVLGDHQTIERHEIPKGSSLHGLIRFSKRKDWSDVLDGTKGT